MKELFLKIKAFFKDRLNLTCLILGCIFLLLFIIPASNIIMRIQMALLAGILGIIAYKFFIKHNKMKEVYDNIDSTRQPKRESSFNKIAEKVEWVSRRNYLLYAIVFGGLACIIILYIFIK